MSLLRLLEAHDPDRVALVDGDETLTYGELLGHAAGARRVLADAGVGPGDHVALLCGNEMAFVVGLLGAWGLGAVVAPVNPYSPTSEVVRKLEPIRPGAVVVGEVGDGPGGHSPIFGAPIVDLSMLPRAGVDDPAIVNVADGEIACLLSTSGVSGTPKVAMLTHENLAWVQRSIIGDGPQQVRSADVALAVLPVAHVLGLNVVVLATLRAGGRVVLQRRFDVDTSLALVRDHRVTTLVGAPPMWQRFASADAPAESMSSLRFARSGAASLPPDIYEAIRAKTGVEVRQGYGLTESSSVVTTGRGLDVRMTSVGKPLPGVELALVDDAGEPVDVGDLGEVVVRSPGVFRGYLDDPEATSAVLSHDGWLWTGDIGVVDDDGYLYLVDRVKDIIIVSGFNVYPAEVEDVLLQHPDVRGALVVGSPHGETGETVVAHVSGPVDQAELDRFARAHLSRYKCPTSYSIVDELPPDPHGKRIRRELRG